MKLFSKSSAPFGLKLIGLFHIIFPAIFGVMMFLIDFYKIVILGERGNLFGMDFVGIGLFFGPILVLFFSPLIVLGISIAYSKRKILLTLSLLISCFYIVFSIIFLWIAYSNYIYSPTVDLYYSIIVFLPFILINLLVISYLMFSKKLNDYYKSNI